MTDGRTRINREKKDRLKKNKMRLSPLYLLNWGWSNPIIPMAEEQEMGFLSSCHRGTAHWKCNTLLPSHRSVGNLNFKRTVNNIQFYFENELCGLHHESNICLNLLGS